VNHAVSFVARLALVSSMLLAALAGLLLIAAAEASSGLPMNLLPEIVIVNEVAAVSAACGPGRAQAFAAARYEATAALPVCEG
jgi:hypothetical protein